jgi:predicted nucleic-acid-binding protein
MRAVDTNILVRLFVNDEPEQFAAAQRALASGPIFIPKTVILECEWVLRGIYGYPRAEIAGVIEGLLSKADVQLEDSVSVERALDWFKRGMDLADALHLASSGHVEAFVSFDNGMRRRSSTIGTEPSVVAP